MSKTPLTPEEAQKFQNIVHEALIEMNRENFQNLQKRMMPSCVAKSETDETSQYFKINGKKKKKNFFLKKNQSRLIKKYIREHIKDESDQIMQVVYEQKCVMDAMFRYLQDNNLVDEDFIEYLRKAFEDGSMMLRTNNPVFMSPLDKMIKEYIPDTDRSYWANRYTSEEAKKYWTISEGDLDPQFNPEGWDAPATKTIDVIDHSQYVLMYEKLQECRQYLRDLVTQVHNVNMAHLVVTAGVPDKIFEMVDRSRPQARIPEKIMNKYRYTWGE